jgi:hypothetical protein
MVGRLQYAYCRIFSQFQATASSTKRSRGAQLEMPGASKIRLMRFEVDRLHWLVDNLNSRCDGFIGMPGFASLYFWTEIPPPGIINNAWITNLDHDRQQFFFGAMASYGRPCVVRNSNLIFFWTRGRDWNPNQPLARYIRTQCQPLREFKPFSLLVKRDRANDAGVKAKGAGR